MSKLRLCLQVLREKEVLQIDFSGDEEEGQKEITPSQLREALQQMQPGKTVIVRFSNEES